MQAYEKAHDMEKELERILKELESKPDELGCHAFAVSPMSQDTAAYPTLA